MRQAAVEVDLSRYDNSFYHRGAPFWKQLVWYFVNALVFSSHIMPVNRVKTFLLRLFGARLGTGVVVKPGVNIKYPWFLETGNHVWFGENVWIDNLATVLIGNNVCISQGAYICTGNHDFRSSDFRLTVAGVRLEDGVWIGARAVVAPGVTCGRNSVLALNSVATTDLDEGWIYQGNPAVKKRQRFS